MGEVSRKNENEKRAREESKFSMSNKKKKTWNADRVFMRFFLTFYAQMGVYREGNGMGWRKTRLIESESATPE